MFIPFHWGSNPMRKSIIDNFVRYGLGGVPQFPRRMSIAKYERFKKIPGDKYRAVQKIGAMSSALGSIRNRFFFFVFAALRQHSNNRQASSSLYTPMSLLLAVYCVASHTGSIKKGQLWERGRESRKPFLFFLGGWGGGHRIDNFVMSVLPSKSKDCRRPNPIHEKEQK